MLDDALDTLGYLFQAYGDSAFRIAEASDEAEFAQLCSELVRHVEQGVEVPPLDIANQPPGHRDWGSLRRFFVDRRKQEKTYVDATVAEYRSAVEDLLAGLRDICAQGEATEETVATSLEAIRRIVEGGDVVSIKAALADTMSTINEAFAKQKQQYEQQISSLQSSMSGLREDLVAAHEEMKQDPLTKLYNRRAFDTSLERYLNVHYMLNQPVSLILIDIDHFKTINDTLGHSAGDDVLCTVSNLMSRAFVRKNDLICRYGGDEFAIILPDTAPEQAQRSIERFLHSVREVRRDEWPESVHVSCSAGCTGMAEGDSVASVVERADCALYAAKQKGRDQLEIA